MSQRLKTLEKCFVSIDGNAGLTTKFMDLDYARIRTVEVLALVLPLTCAQRGIMDKS